MYFIFGPLQQIFFSWCYVNKADIFTFVFNKLHGIRCIIKYTDYISLNLMEISTLTIHTAVC